MAKNKLIVAAAGAGKTTYLVNQAFSIKDGKVLITTYTRSNAEEIRKKIRERNKKETGYYSIPENILVEEWFTFLLSNGVRPYKSVMNNSLRYKNIGFFPESEYRKLIADGKIKDNIYIQEKEVLSHYFVNHKIIQNVLSKFVVKTDQLGGGCILNRIENMYNHIFIDEVQDLAGNDLELIQLLFKSKSRVILVGDPRQTTYLTHHEKMNSKYSDGKIKEYVSDKCKKCDVEVDETILKFSHRNNVEICNFSSNLYPDFVKTEPCTCKECRTLIKHTGVFVIRPKDLGIYVEKYGQEICILRDKLSAYPERNFGDSKGLTFERVLIYPTQPIVKYLKDGILVKSVKNKKGVFEDKKAFDIAKFYVAVTRAKHSVAIVLDYKDHDVFIEGVSKYDPSLDV